MHKFIIFYKGPATPPDASHEGWPEWFSKIGEKLVDRGMPMVGGFTVQSNGTATNMASSFNGYSIIQAENRDEACSLLKDHPYLALGNDYSIEVFELPQQ